MSLLLFWPPDSGGAPVVTPTWTDMSQYLRDDQAISFHRGRQDELAEYDAGDFSSILDPAMVGDNRRSLEPMYPGALYYPYVLPEKRCRYSLEYPWLPGVLTDYLNETLSGWTGDINTTLSLAASHFLKSGQGLPLGNSVRMTSVAGGVITADAPWMQVLPGQHVAGSMRFQAPGGTGRTVNVRVTFYDNTLTALTSYDSTLEIDSNDSWTRCGLTAIAPVDAAWARFSAIVQDTVIGESHDVCCIALEYASFEGIFPQITVFADDWDPVWREGMDAWTLLTGHDGFKLLGGRPITNAGYATLMKSYDPKAYYRLGDPLHSVLVKNEMDDNAPARAYPATTDPEAGVVFGVEGALPVDIDTAADFSVAAGWIDCDTTASITGAGEFSITFLAKYSDASTPGAILAQGNYGEGTGQGGFWRIYSSGTVGTLFDANFSMFDEIPSYDFRGFHIPNMGGDMNWHLVTISRAADGRHYDLFVDGAVVVPTVPTGGVIVGTQYYCARAVNFPAYRALIGGENDYASGFEGVIDEVAFSQHAMTLAEHQALYSLFNLIWDGQTAGERINSVLDVIGWPTTDRQLDPGTQVLPPQLTALSQTNTKAYLQQVEQSEGGQLFMGADNEVTFLDRHTLYTAPYTQVQAVFGDRPGTIDTATGLPELPFGPTTPTFGDSTVYTAAQVSRQLPDGSDGPVQYVTDPSMVNNPEKVLQRDKLLLPDDLSAWEYANYLFVIYRTPMLKFSQLEIDPTGSDELMKQVITRKLGDRVAIVRRPPGWQTGDAPMRVECIIVGIDGSDSRKKISRTYRLGQVASTPFLILDDPVFGKLDSGNYLGF